VVGMVWPALGISKVRVWVAGATTTTVSTGTTTTTVGGG
jgi:hypothetical protein